MTNRREMVSDEDILSFTNTMKALDDYFVRKSTVPFERHLFRQIVQASDETVDQFVCRLQQRAASCDFRVLQDDYTRHQVIDELLKSFMSHVF